MPKLVIHAFLAAEDKNFYEHGGLDFTGIARAAVNYLQNYGSNRHPQGASTITQQVAKNFLLSNEVSFTRKIKEALLALKIERTYSKDKILELYLNEIYLGLGAYGIAAASLVYFDKSVNELTVAEAAYLAALPKAPNNYHPFRQHERAIERRNWVIDQMAEDGFIKTADAEKAKRQPLGVTQKPTGAHMFSAEYFAEEVRRELYDRYGEKKLYEGGLSVRTTLDTKLQVLARKVLTEGLVHYDEAQGWRGPVSKIDVSGDWGVKLAEVKALAMLRPGGWRWCWKPATSRLASACSRGASRAAIQQGTRRRHRAARRREMGQDQRPRAEQSQPGARARRRRLCLAGQRFRPIPFATGAGSLRRHGGGGSLDRPRARHGRRLLLRPEPVQPRHAGAAPARLLVQAVRLCGRARQRLHAVDLVLDAPLEIDQGPGLGVWKPENYEDNFFGPSTLRFGIEHSRNVMTVRLAQDIGMPMIADYAKRFGVYDHLPPYLSFALGAGETTLLRMVTAYAMIDNGGRRVKPTLIDRIQDRYGHTVYKHDERECIGCDAKKWADQPEPSLIDRREQVLDPMTAYQITSMMEGVVQRGTAAGARFQKDVGKPVAGKTGTTNDDKDAWFIGFSPDIVCGVYIGFDKPRHLGRGKTGGHLAAPIVRDFMKMRSPISRRGRSACRRESSSSASI